MRVYIAKLLLVFSCGFLLQAGNYPLSAMGENYGSAYNKTQTTEETCADTKNYLPKRLEACRWAVFYYPTLKNYIIRIRALQAAQEWETAQAVLDEAREKHPQELLLAYLQGEQWIQQGEKKKLSLFFETQQTHFKQNPFFSIYWADLLEKQGDLASARMHYQEALKWASDKRLKTDILVMLSANWQQQNKPQQALKAIDQALQYTPDLPPLLMTRIQLNWEAKRDLKLLEADLNHLLRVDPGNYRHYENRAHLEWAKGEPFMALHFLTLAIELLSSEADFDRNIHKIKQYEKLLQTRLDLKRRLYAENRLL